MNSLTGNLSWDAITLVKAIKDPNLNNLITAGAAAMIPLGALALALVLTWKGWWGALFRDWLRTTDHKRIGILYLLLAGVMLFRGVVEGTLMRVHQAGALNGGLLTSDHFNQLFTTHGTTMIFFVVMPLLIGLMNVVVPLQIGARDVTYPVLNQVSFWMTAAGAALITISLLVGEFSTGGWTNYPSYIGKVFSPGVGPDYWLFSVGLAGVGSTLTGVNFAVTIYKERTQGMTFMRMPHFVWASLCTAILLIFAMPPITTSIVMLLFDRYLGFHFFTNDLGGNLMNYINLFWMFGHPEVYILILPAFGVMSEISSTFSAKKLYGYPSIVAATMCIAVLSFLVWLHHFFTMGQSASVNIAFGIATLLISIPTGVKVYDWLATLFRGRIRFTTPVYYLSGFFVLFIIGGLSGIVLANPTLDYQVHNSLFLVAHFHNVLIPGTLFGMLAGVHYWFPKMFGYRLLEGYGKATAVLWIVGFCVTFLPLYPLGLMGMTRRTVDYSNPEYLPYMITAAAGALILSAAFGCLVLTFWRSYVHRRRLAVPLGDPWDGRSLEWWTPSPPPEWNFSVRPVVHGRDAFAIAKKEGDAGALPAHFEPIRLPANTSYGMILGGLAAVMGFTMVWHLMWLSLLSSVGIVLIVAVYAILPKTETVIPAEEVARVHQSWHRRAKETVGITRDDENTARNQGLARPDILPIS